MHLALACSLAANITKNALRGQMRTAAVVPAVNVAPLALLGTACQQNHKLGKPKPAIRQKTRSTRYG
jgi:hypothetical protein